MAVETQRERSAEQDAAIAWFKKRGVPHFRGKGVDVEVEDRRLSLAFVLCMTVAYGFAISGSAGLDRLVAVGIPTGTLAVALMVLVLERALSRTNHKSWIPQPGRMNWALVVAISAASVVGIAHDGVTPTAISLLVAAGVIIVLVAAATPPGLARILWWSFGHPLREFRYNVGVVVGAVPLLLLTTGFLFLQNEVWQAAVTMTGSEFWLTLALFLFLGALLIAALAESRIVDASKFKCWEDVSKSIVVPARTGLGGQPQGWLGRAWLWLQRCSAARRLDTSVRSLWAHVRDNWPGFKAESVLAAEPAHEGVGVRPAVPKRLCDFEPDKTKCPRIPLDLRERANIRIVVWFGLANQVASVTLFIAAFFLAFGALAVDEDTLANWGVFDPAPGFEYWTELHLRVTALLSVFAGLSYVAYAAVYQEQRDLFMAELERKIRQRFAVRAIFRVLPPPESSEQSETASR